MTYKEKVEKSTGLEMRIEGNGIGSIYLGEGQLSDDCVECWFDCTPDCDCECKECWNKECLLEPTRQLEDSMFMEGVPN